MIVWPTLSWVDPAPPSLNALVSEAFQEVPAWGQGNFHHSPIVMFPKPSVTSRSLCSLSWCFDSFRTPLVHSSRLVNTEWITPNLKSTSTRTQLWSPGELHASGVRWRHCTRARSHGHTHTPTCLHPSFLAMILVSPGSSDSGWVPVWEEAVPWELPKPQSWHSVIILNLPVLNSLSMGQKETGSWKQGSRDGNVLKAHTNPTMPQTLPSRREQERTMRER